MKREPWRERWIHPEVKEILLDLKWAVLGILGSVVLVRVINGIFALCEWLKTINVS